MSTWRQEANTVIGKVLREHGRPTNHDELRALEKALSKAYPFGEREHWPYKVWLSCVREALMPYRTRYIEPPPSPGCGDKREKGMFG